MKDTISFYNNLLQNKNTSEILDWAIDEFGVNLTLASSLGPQSIILTKLLKDKLNQPDIFFLDTGRLPAETYSLLNTCMDFFEIKYRIFFPDKSDLEEYIHQFGPNGFYESLENRKKCCEIRKVKSLKRALTGYQAWITGVRRDQNFNRAESNIVEWDARYNIFKINPMLDWTEEDVWNFISDNNLPYNKLHDQNYPSIGCAPCTRAITNDEDPRAGRWWWEVNSTTECGINLLVEPVSVEMEEVQIPNILKFEFKEYS